MSRQLFRKTIQVNTRRWKIAEKVSIFKDFFRFIWERIVVCSTGNFNKYKSLLSTRISEESKDEDCPETAIIFSGYHADDGDDSDLVALKICILGDCQIGKTSFVIPIACKDAVAILFMFDLTNRSTLNNVIDWYKEARKWNQTAIPILIGTKFDDFVQLPTDIQWTVVTQARAYAKAMKATLFFSSATHNINVNKIFKFIMAKLFNLPWTVQRNLNIGEPIIDF
ncbi:hypothetical protein HAX54_001908 [Datura stramonium]|uniref:Uncharacterized protein n=1 Tax=Datura stramonium TaxID=4076 RepID=A0ABS8RST2_DATST|nr:hypothetical protein [Datura stramonium]